MKRFVKIALIVVAVVGGLFLIASQFVSTGTSDEGIAYYDFKKDFEKALDSLVTDYTQKNIQNVSEIYAQLEIVKAMEVVDSYEVDQYKEEINNTAEFMLKSYFTRGVWVTDDMNRIKILALYMDYQYALNAISGYYSIQSIVANSKVCRTQTQVENCIAASQKYTKTPWTYNTSLKEGLNAVPNNAFNSFTNRTLIPKCVKMNNFKDNYEYFDDFDADYQIVKNAIAYMTGKQYSDSNLDTKFKSIKYNDAANILDPKFF